MSKNTEAQKVTERKTERKLKQVKGHTPRQKIATQYNYNLMRLRGVIQLLESNQVAEMCMLSGIGNFSRLLILTNLQSLYSSLRAKSQDNLLELYAKAGLETKSRK